MATDLDLSEKPFPGGPGAANESTISCLSDSDRHETNFHLLFGALDKPKCHLRSVIVWRLHYRRAATAGLNSSLD